jgi:iturin family lipopeptide synthetase A
MSSQGYWQRIFAQPAFEPINLDLMGENSSYQSVARNVAELRGPLIAACRSKDQELPTVLLCAFSVVLAKLTGVQDFIVKVRGKGGTILPLRTIVDRKLPFSRYVAQVSCALAELHQNEEEFDQDQSKMPDSASPIFWDGDGFDDAGNDNLALQVRDESTIVCAAAASPERAYVLGEILNAQYRILEQVIDNWEIPLKCLQLVSATDRHKLLVDFNRTDTEFLPQTFQRIFEQQAEIESDRVAVHDGSVSLTYCQLNQRANQLAHRLRKLGVKRNQICGILVPRSVNYHVALFGILKAGGAFVSFDPAYPRERIRFMMQDSGCRVVVGQGASTFGKDVAFIDAEDPGLQLELETNPEDINLVDDLAYVIYTSGTTGIPKGVMLCHEGIASFAQHYKNSFAFSPEDKVLNFFSPSFDGSISELTMSLLAGTSFYILPDGIKASYRLFEQYINQHRITVATIPPPFLSYLDPKAFPTLHTIFVAGSESTKKLLDKWTGSVAMVNHYGPTEVTICATEWKAPRGPIPYSTVPIGTPIANKKVYIVNADGDLQPPGIRGELCVSGIRLSPGYLNQPELTSEKFVLNRLVTELTDANRDRHGVYYRTGDWARWLPDGNIEFLGRIDNQVKIRGFRVELGEVEQAIMGAAGVRESAVITRKDDTGENTLYGFFAGSASEEEVRTLVAARLPAYMVPDRFLKVEMMPLTGSDKVDKKRLEALLSAPSEITPAELPRPASGHDAIAQSVLEFIIASSDGAVPSAVMNWSDNLEQLGINSLRFIKLMLKIEERFGLEFEGEFFIGRKGLTVGAVVRETQKRVVSQ